MPTLSYRTAFTCLHRFILILAGLTGATIAFATDDHVPQQASAPCPPAWVLVEFTVTPGGQMTDLTVLDASHSGIYESLAKQVVRRWTWAPRATEERVSERVEFELYGCPAPKTEEDTMSNTTCGSVCA